MERNKRAAGPADNPSLFLDACPSAGLAAISLDRLHPDHTSHRAHNCLVHATQLTLLNSQLLNSRLLNSRNSMRGLSSGFNCGKGIWKHELAAGRFRFPARRKTNTEVTARKLKRLYRVCRNVIKIERIQKICCFGERLMKAQRQGWVWILLLAGFALIVHWAIAARAQDNPQDQQQGPQQDPQQEQQDDQDPP